MIQRYDYSEVIKASITMRQAINRYLPGVRIENNRIPCPFHNGSKRNLSIRDSFYHCFVCGCGGDVIRFVGDLHNYSRLEAMEQLNKDFCLNLPLGKRITLRESQIYSQKYDEFIKKHNAEQAKERLAQERYDAAVDIWCLYDRWRTEYKPTSPDDEIDIRYIIAVQNIDAASYQLDLL